MELPHLLLLRSPLAHHWLSLVVSDLRGSWSCRLSTGDEVPVGRVQPRLQHVQRSHKSPADEPLWVASGGRTAQLSTCLSPHQVGKIKLLPWTLSVRFFRNTEQGRAMYESCCSGGYRKDLPEQVSAGLLGQTHGSSCPMQRGRGWENWWNGTIQKNQSIYKSIYVLSDKPKKRHIFGFTDENTKVEHSF